MFTLDPATLEDTRIQLHWAAQLLSAAADATLEKAADDSHSNVGWDVATHKMVGRAGCNLYVETFELEAANEKFILVGKTLNESAEWLAQKLDAPIAFRDYDMPQHGVANGQTFSPAQEPLEELATWFTFGANAMEGFGDPRIWPHHLDLGFLLLGDIEGGSVGGGFSPGDDHFNMPYFYVNPYGVEQPVSLPELPIGIWTNKWLGAVLTADELLKSDDPGSAAKSFVSAGVAICQKIIAG